MSKTYTTVQGDMWDSIAHAQLGDTAYTDRLMNANSRYCAYYIFPAGIILMLPDTPVPTGNMLPPWKQAK